MTLHWYGDLPCLALNEIDTEFVEAHLQRLRDTNESKPNLRNILSTRLGRKMEELRTPDFSNARVFDEATANLDSSWYLFDQASLQVGNEEWYGVGI